ncbi:MAG: tRNA pseudouridine(13) synthase TruD [Vibrio sp.]
MTDILAPFAHQFGQPTATAFLKAQPEDFCVAEDLGFEFSGQGEHLMVQIEKRGENTSFVANELAKFCGVTSKAMGWAGLKDRHAVTTQWLSIHLPQGDAPDFAAFEALHPSVRILQTQRHHQKLRSGDLIANDFTIRLTQVSDMDAVLTRLDQVKTKQVPNYFGQQRFGRDGNNLSEARRWGRDNVRTRNQNKRSLYLSTARSWIFNQILSKRIEAGLLQTLVEGDIILHKDDARTQIVVDADNRDELQFLLNEGQVLLTAALAGDNALPTQGQAQALEQACVDAEEDLMKLIRGNRMRHDRRPVLLEFSNLEWQQDGDSLSLTFRLPAGSFATMLLREIADCHEAPRNFE